MATVFTNVNGKPFDHWLSHTRMVREALREEAMKRGDIAKAIHAQHRDEGHSFIEVKREGKLDWYVILNDTRGLLAAMSIEFGRGPDEDGNRATSGTNTLHRAFGINIERTFPRSRRRKRFNRP